MKPQMNIDEPGTAWPQPKNKKKSPRTHLSQVWIPAFRLPWVRSRLKPELRTSPQRRGERPKILCFLQKDFVASSCLRGEMFLVAALLLCVHPWFRFVRSLGGER